MLEELKAAGKYFKAERLAKKTEGSLLWTSKDSAASRACNEAERAGVPPRVLRAINRAATIIGTQQNSINNKQ